MSAWDHSPQIVGPKLANSRLVGRVCNKTQGGGEGGGLFELGDGREKRGAGWRIVAHPDDESKLCFI